MVLITHMILNYGASNFFCFEEGAEVSFEFPPKCPTDITNGDKFSRLLCVTGANASGKTNLLKILTFIGSFMKSSFTRSPKDKIAYMSFFDNQEESQFYLEIKIGEYVYTYNLKCTPEKVLSEEVHRRKKGENVELIKREGDKITRYAKDLALYKNLTIKGNASVISTLVDGHEDEILKPLVDYWVASMSNIRWSGYFNENDDFIKVSKFYNDSSELCDFTSQFISNIDPSVEGFELEERTDEEGNNFYLPMFIHKLDGEKSHKLAYNFQSNGTKILYNELVKVAYALMSGSILIFDELDANLHPDVIKLILDHFTDKDRNIKNAQLIFTTHNSEVLNYLSKYQTYIVEKNNSGSYTYRVDEISDTVVRTDRSLRSYYEKNLIGGRPEFSDRILSTKSIFK